MINAIEWPNKLGFEVGSAEVFKHADKFRVFTDDRAMLVPYSVTTNPVTAVEICEREGLSREMLEYDMNPQDAQRLFENHLPTQKELF